MNSRYNMTLSKFYVCIIRPLNQHFNLKNQRNWIKQALMLKFLCGINCILLHWPKKLTLEPVCLPLVMMQLNVYQKGNDRSGKVFENKLKLDSLYCICLSSMPHHHLHLIFKHNFFHINDDVGWAGWDSVFLITMVWYAYTWAKQCRNFSSHAVKNSFCQI